jgi:hypothetical protein
MNLPAATEKKKIRNFERYDPGENLTMFVLFFVELLVYTKVHYSSV